MINKFKIPKDIYNDLIKCVDDRSIENNKNLAGNIREEYSLQNYLNKFEPFFLNECIKSNFLSNYFKKLNILWPNSQNLILSHLWSNIQKKYEFNPVHEHSGIFSFILFIKIPYLAEEQFKKAPGYKSMSNKAGTLSFFDLDSNSPGGIRETNLKVDKKWEGTGLIFKSDLKHCVYPFYTEGDRITISGNISINNRRINDA